MPFAELNILHNEQQSLEEKISMASRLGYEVVAVTTVYKRSQGNKKKKKDESDTKLPKAGSILLSEECVHRIKHGTQPLKQLSRIQFNTIDHGVMHALGTKEIQAYDIVAVKATDEKFFKSFVDSPYIDIITFDVSEKIPFLLKHTPVKVAMSRGIHFEIEYGPALRDSSVTRQMICNTQHLVRCCKGKNIILSSGCERAIELRGPHDVANLGVMLGLSQSQASDMIYRNWNAILKNSEGRMLTKQTVGHFKLSDLSTEDEWVKEKLSVNKLKTNKRVHSDSREETPLKKKKVEK